MSSGCVHLNLISIPKGVSVDEKIMEMFIEQRRSAYDIHNKLGCSIKQVYHVIKQYEEKVRSEAKIHVAD